MLITFSPYREPAQRLAKMLNLQLQIVATHTFPDGEVLIRIKEKVRDRNVYIYLPLDAPNDKILPLYFLAKTLKAQGAQRVILIAPYLAYMRQDIEFHPGESVTADEFAELLSWFLDGIITIDPHLHRHHSLSEIYSIPAYVVHAAPAIADWVKKKIHKPLFIGPDIESSQWVTEIAEECGAPYEVLIKKRSGDDDITVSAPDTGAYKDHTPVIVDDIISTAHTMAETARAVLAYNLNAPVCIGVHGVFAGNALQLLLDAGVSQVLTSNTIPHQTNTIDIIPLLFKALENNALNLFRPKQIKVMNTKQKLIIVGMDFSPLAYKALEYAILFAEIHDAKILTVFAIEPPHDIADWLDSGSYEEAQEKAAEKAFKKLIGKYETDDRKISYAIAIGRPHIVLLHAQQEHNAEMVVLGSHGHNHREPIMGTVASKMLRSADCPVVVVPEEVDEPRIKKAMIAVDREFGIREIRRFLSELPQIWDIDIVLTTVVTHSQQEIAEAEAHLAKQRAALEKLGFDKVETEIIHSDDIIIGLISHAEKEENEIDLVMMETHGRKGLSRFFIGSISEQVVIHANVPVFSLCPERRKSHYPSQWQFQ